jgi:hypothetical protein
MINTNPTFLSHSITMAVNCGSNGDTKNVQGVLHEDA